MTPDQLQAIFTNMSTQTGKIIASNQANMEFSTMALAGVLCALIWAATWKG